MYRFSRVNNRRVVKVKKKSFFGVALAILPLPPSYQPFLTTSMPSWEFLIQKLRF